MTEDELQNSFADFNSRYSRDRLNYKVVVTDDWIERSAFTDQNELEQYPIRRR